MTYFAPCFNNLFLPYIRTLWNPRVQHENFETELCKCGNLCLPHMQPLFLSSQTFLRADEPHEHSESCITPSLTARLLWHLQRALQSLKPSKASKAQGLVDLWRARFACALARPVGPFHLPLSSLLCCVQVRRRFACGGKHPASLHVGTLHRKPASVTSGIN